MSSRILLLLAALPAALSATSSAPLNFDMSCPSYQEYFRTIANATGSVTFPGIQRSNRTLSISNDEKDEWKIDQTVYRDQTDLDTVGYSFLHIPFNNSLERNITNSHELPFIVCVQELFLWPEPNGDGAMDDDGSCRNVFGGPCLEDLKEFFGNHAENFTVSTSNATNPCGNFWRQAEGFPASCSAPLKNNGAASPIGPQSGIAPYRSDLLNSSSELLGAPASSCPINLFTRRFDGTNTNIPLPEPADNLTTFGRAQKLINPFIVVRIANDSLVDKWSDAKIVCAKTSRVTWDTRLPRKENDGYMLRGSIMGVLGLVAVIGWML